MSHLARERPINDWYFRTRFVLVGFALAIWSGCHSSALRTDQIPMEYRSDLSSRSVHRIDLARAASPGSSQALIAPEDLLQITVATGRDGETLVPIQSRVAEDGTTNIPLIGPVPVAGMEAFDASRNIAQLAIERGIYTNPHITVEIESKAVNRITVLGAVVEPGVHEIPRGSSDLVSALAASGGLSKEAGTEIEIVRQPRFGVLSNGVLANEDPANPDKSATTSDIQLAAYQQVGQGSAKPGATGWSSPQTVRFDLASDQPLQNIDYQLNDRDVVRVIPRKKEVVYVDGLVSTPGEFELPLEQDLHVLDAIALAGGRSSPVADKVFVIRRAKDQSKPIVIQVSIREAKRNGRENLRLLAGDTVSIEQTPVTAVVDSFNKFFRLSFGVARNSVF